MIRLNIGCDNDVRLSNNEIIWINIDQFNFKHPCVKFMDARKLDFPDDYFDEICARDVLEHISWRETDSTLQEWYRVLKPNGKIYIQAINLKGWAEAILKNKCSFHHAMDGIYAHQDNPGNFHKAGFCKDDIQERMEKIGFKNIEHLSEDRTTPKTDIDTNVHVWAIK
jgi:ubiquinone/menaquinone biosynthesis C-methylase UbiE